MVAFALSAVWHMIGFMVTWGKKKEERLAGVISLAYVNSVMIVVFSSQFFGPLSATVAAVYNLPFFMMIVPARMAGEWLEKNT